MANQKVKNKCVQACVCVYLYLFMYVCVCVWAPGLLIGQSEGLKGSCVQACALRRVRVYILKGAKAAECMHGQSEDKELLCTSMCACMYVCTLTLMLILFLQPDVIVVVKRAFL